MNGLSKQDTANRCPTGGNVGSALPRTPYSDVQGMGFPSRTLPIRCPIGRNLGSALPRRSYSDVTGKGCPSRTLPTRCPTGRWEALCRGRPIVTFIKWVVQAGRYQYDVQIGGTEALCRGRPIYSDVRGMGCPSRTLPIRCPVGMWEALCQGRPIVTCLFVCLFHCLTSS